MATNPISSGVISAFVSTLFFSAPSNTESVCHHHPCHQSEDIECLSKDRKRRRTSGEFGTTELRSSYSSSVCHVFPAPASSASQGVCQVESAPEHSTTVCQGYMAVHWTSSVRQSNGFLSDVDKHKLVMAMTIRPSDQLRTLVLVRARFITAKQKPSCSSIRNTSVRSDPRFVNTPFLAYPAATHRVCQ